jgi:hypothetical protein
MSLPEGQDNPTVQERADPSESTINRGQRRGCSLSIDHDHPQTLLFHQHFTKTSSSLHPSEGMQTACQAPFTFTVFTRLPVPAASILKINWHLNPGNLKHGF